MLFIYIKHTCIIIIIIMLMYASEMFTVLPSIFDIPIIVRLENMKCSLNDTTCCRYHMPPNLPPLWLICHPLSYTLGISI